MEIRTRELNTEFCEIMNRLAPVFAGEPAFKKAQKYTKGLLGTAERKNGWQLAEYLGESTPYALQQFIYRGRYSADKMRDVAREYTVDNLGDEDGVMVVDETGFLKQGTKSCGVKRQYSGTAGRIENCQIGVFLTYASPKGFCPIDRRLYLPKEWANDSKRRKEAGIPEDVDFRTKPQLALRMIKEATESRVPYSWVTGDCVYGDNRAIRGWLERNQKGYVLCVSSKEYIHEVDQYVSVGSVLKDLPEEGWFEASCGDGSKGPRISDWQLRELASPGQEGWKRWLLVRRSKTDAADLQAYLCFAPAKSPNIDNCDISLRDKLIKVAGTRWTVETSFKESKSEVGLDQYEVRTYDGWYKHITFACIALALLTVLSSKSLDTKSLQEHDPATSDLEGFKKGAKNARLSKGDLRKIIDYLYKTIVGNTYDHLVAWIQWRREHQAVAMWHHYQKSCLLQL